MTSGQAMMTIQAMYKYFKVSLFAGLVAVGLFVGVGVHKAEASNPCITINTITWNVGGYLDVDWTLDSKGSCNNGRGTGFYLSTSSAALGHSPAFGSVLYGSSVTSTPGFNGAYGNTWNSSAGGVCNVNNKPYSNFNNGDNSVDQVDQLTGASGATTTAALIGQSLYLHIYNSGVNCSAQDSSTNSEEFIDSTGYVVGGHAAGAWIDIVKPTNNASTTADMSEPPPGMYVHYDDDGSSSITSSTPGIVEIRAHRVSPISYGTTIYASYAYLADDGSVYPGTSIPTRGQLFTDGTWELTAYLYDYTDYTVYSRGATLATSSVITVHVGGTGIPVPAAFSCAFNIPFAGSVDPCAWIGALFMPSQASIDQFSSLSLSDKEPFATFGTISTLWSSATSTSASAGSLTIRYRMPGNATSSIVMFSSSTIRTYIPDSTWTILQGMLQAGIWLGALLYLYRRITGHHDEASVLK